MMNANRQSARLLLCMQLPEPNGAPSGLGVGAVGGSKIPGWVGHPANREVHNATHDAKQYTPHHGVQIANWQFVTGRRALDAGFPAW